MTPERAREVMRLAGGFAPMVFMTFDEIRWIGDRLDAVPNNPLTLADMVRLIAKEATS